MTVAVPTGLTPSPVDLRAELELLIVADLLGPTGGEEEEIDGREYVRDRYIVGALAPRSSVAIDPERTDDDGVEGDDSLSQPSDGESNPAQSTLFPSSFGMSFAVDGSQQALRIEVSWGRYERRARDAEEGSKPRQVWRRVPVRGEMTIPLIEGTLEPVSPLPEQADVRVRGRASRLNGDWLVTLFLVNGQPTPEKLRDRAWLFQPRLTVEAPEGQAAFIARSSLLVAPEAGDPERAQLDLLYRDEFEFAVGHGIATTAHRSDDPSRATRLETTAIPVYEVLRTEAPSIEERPDLVDLTLDMKELSDLPTDAIAEAVRPIASAYSAWLDTQEQRIADDPGVAGHQTSARLAIDDGRVVARRLMDAVDLLAVDATAADAFRFANRAMWLQRVHTEASKLRRERPDLSPDAAVTEVDGPANRTWRPFQLAFVLLNLPSLTDPRHAERRQPASPICSSSRPAAARPRRTSG